MWRRLETPRACLVEFHVAATTSGRLLSDATSLSRGGSRSWLQRRLSFPGCHELVSLASTQIFKGCSSRLCRPMCGSGFALPAALGFFPGLRPNCLALKIVETEPEQGARKAAFYLIPERWGRSPEEKGRRSRKGVAASAHRAAKPQEKQSSKICVDANELVSWRLTLRATVAGNVRLHDARSWHLKSSRRSVATNVRLHDARSWHLKSSRRSVATNVRLHDARSWHLSESCLV